MYIAILLLLAMSMLICHIIAKNKNRNPVAWGVSGAILGPIAILLIAFLPPKKPTSR